MAESEQLVALSRLANAAALRGASVTPRRLRDWHTRGKLLPGGERVYLSAERIGGQWQSSERRLAEFLERCRGRAG